MKTGIVKAADLQIGYELTNRAQSLVVFFAALLYGGTCMAQTVIHVPTDVPTIQSGIDAAKDGDTVLVSPGTYTEDLDFKGKAITVTSGAKTYADAAATILHGASSGPTVVFKTGESRSSILNGLTIEDSATTAVFFNDASGTLSNSVVANSHGCGVVAQGTNANPLIHGNHLWGTRNDIPSCQTSRVPYVGISDPGSALSLIGFGDMEVSDNLIEANAGDASVWIEGAPTSTLLFKNNVIRNNGGSGTPLFALGVGHLNLVQNLIFKNQESGSGSSGSVGGAIRVYDSVPFQPPGYVLIEGNTVFENTYRSDTEGIQLVLGGQIALATVENNIFVSSRPGLVVSCSTGSNFPIVFRNNDLFNKTSSVPLTDCTQNAGANLSANLSVDPQFVDSAASDFHTQRTSPVIAVGDINAPMIPSADLDGRARTVCGTIDMGVYQIRPHPPVVLTITPNPAPGQSTVTLTATVTGNCNTPTGVVTFLDGSTVLGTAPLNSGAVASFATSFLFVGTHPITATYPGDFNFEDGTSNTVTEVITGPPTTTVLNSVNPNPTHPLQTITMTATVSSAYTVPTGNITFMAGGSPLATTPVGSNGSATATVSTLHAGTYSITAVYSGSTQYAASTSNAITETVISTDTTTVLTASPNPVAPGQLLILAANVSDSQGIAVTGMVSFKESATVLGTGVVGTNGLATFGTSGLLTGTHLLTAVYGGAQDLNTSVSAPIAVVITAVPTSIGLSVSPNPASVGQTVNMVATAVASPSTQPPTGTVTFLDQSSVLGIAPLVSGVASFSTTSLSVGTHQITVTLNPTGSFGSNTSAPVAEVITDYNFSLAVSSTSLTIPSGDHQVLSVTVTPSGGFPRAVNLSCASLPIHAQCYFDPSRSKPLSEGAQTLKLQVETSDVLGYGHQVGRSMDDGAGYHGDSKRPANLIFPLGAFCALAGGFSRRFSARLRRLLMLVAMAGIGMGMMACSGKLPGATPPGRYVFTVSATDADSTTGLTHLVNVSLTVQ